MFCPKCGTKVEAGQKFCPRCGTALASAVQMPQQGATRVRQQAAPQAPRVAAQQPTPNFGAQPVGQPVAQPVGQPAAQPAAQPFGASYAAPAYQHGGFGAQATGTIERFGKLIGKVVVLIMLFLPCFSIPLFKALSTLMKSDQSSYDQMVQQIPGINKLLVGEWNMWGFHNAMEPLNNLMNYLRGQIQGDELLQYSSLFDAINSLNAFATIALVLWVVCILGVVVAILSDLVEQGMVHIPLNALASKHLSRNIMIGVGVLAVVWCIVVLHANSSVVAAIRSMAYQQANGGYSFDDIFAMAIIWIKLPVWPKLAAILALVTAFWPNLCKGFNLTR